MKPQFGLTAHDYARHRAGFPESFFERLAALQIGVQGQDVLDLGTGTGTLARGFARRGCRVTGVDPAEDLLAKAEELHAAERGPNQLLQVPHRVFSVVARRPTHST